MRCNTFLSTFILFGTFKQTLRPKIGLLSKKPQNKNHFIELLAKSLKHGVEIQ